MNLNSFILYHLRSCHPGKVLALLKAYLFICKMQVTGFKQVAQWLRVCATLPEDPNLIHGTHVGRLTTACNPAPEYLTPPSASALVCTNPHRNTHIHVNQQY